MDEKTWVKNAPNMIVVYSIFAAIAGGLLVFVLQDQTLSKSWKLPVFFFASSFFLFVLTAERVSEAIIEQNIKKRIAYMFLYNLGVILLLFGGALTIHYKYSDNLFWFVLIAFFMSFPWISDVVWLLRSNDEEFDEYVDELNGKKIPSPQKRAWEKIFDGIRCI